MIDTFHSPKQKRSAQTRERILAAAETLLNGDPFGELSMPRIAEEAGVSVGGLYGRFPSREALLDAVHARYRRRRDAKLAAALADDAGDVAARLERIARAFVDLHASDAGVLRSFIIATWLTRDGGPPADVTAEIGGHKAKMAAYVLAGAPVSQRRRIRPAVERAVRYLISVSKDQLVISPDTARELRAVDRDRLARDIAAMAQAVVAAASSSPTNDR
jgi:AcrR family transcriptional regulator